MTTLKIRLYKSQMISALVWYVNKLTEKFLYRPLTPATLVAMQAYLDDLQNYASRNTEDFNPAWQLKVRIVPNHQTSTVSVEPADESKFLYLDFDQ